MEFDILKTRRGKLRRKIQLELDKPHPDIECILGAVNDYEKANLATIEKLRKRRTNDIKKINGAIKQAINAHGDITRVLISSAGKRVYGALLEHPKDNFLKRVLKIFK